MLVLEIETLGAVLLLRLMPAPVDSIRTRSIETMFPHRAGPSPTQSMSTSAMRLPGETSANTPLSPVAHSFGRRCVALRGAGGWGRDSKREARECKCNEFRQGHGRSVRLTLSSGVRPQIDPASSERTNLARVRSHPRLEGSVDLGRTTQVD